MKIRSKAPLRLSFAGGGTELSPYADIHGGEVLNATISMFAHVLIAEIKSEVVFEATDLNLRDSFSMSEVAKGKKSLALHYGVYSVMMERFNDGKNIPLSIKTYCDAPVGSGLGSSSTLTVAMVEAFNRLMRLNLDEYEIARLAYEIERVELNLSGGKQDQYAAAFGGINYIEFKPDTVVVNSLRLRSWIASELESRLLLYYTGQSRESANIIESQVNSMRNDNEEIYKALHQIKECAREMKISLLQGDLDSFGRKLHESWIMKRSTDAKVTNLEIDRLYDIALNNGALGGKISGAGGGGFMMIICEADRTHEVYKAIDGNSGLFFPVVLTGAGASSWLVP